MSTHCEHSLIGSVVERATPRTPSVPSSRFYGTSVTGFPTAQHRFKSTFARARNEANSRFIAQQTPPSVAQTADSKPVPIDTDALRRQIHDENAQTIARMSEEEIEQEKRAILEQLGEGTAQLLTRIQEVRQRKVENGRRMFEGQERVQDAVEHKHLPLASPIPVPPALATKPGILRVKSLENIGQSVPSPLPATSSTRPSSRTGRKLRFAEVTPDDVHVYESAPVSPKRTILALPPPPDTKDDSIMSLGSFRGHVIPSEPAEVQSTGTQISRGNGELEEGTPEDIRRRYFPNVLPNDPNLAWMETPRETNTSTPRFDLHGTPISPSLSASLPSHLGLHHHAEGSHAGYTIDDLFILVRSTVPAQRALMLGVLAKIARRLGQQVRRSDNTEGNVFVGQEGELRKRILSSVFPAIGQIGSLGARAVEVVWECLVGWDSTTSELEGIELGLAPDIVSLLRPEHFLPQIADVLSHAALPSESLAQLLTILHWLAQQSNQIADMITVTPRLVPTILSTFLLTPIPPQKESPLPDPLVLQLLITLASASRSNASALLDPADALLRFVTLLPPSSPYPSDIASTLLTFTLQFYTTLASYGLYSHTATTATEIFTALNSYIHSSLPSSVESIRLSASAAARLRSAWATLVESWIVCATDPHATSPPHEILWSQICAWGWAADLRQFRNGPDNETSGWALYTAIWDAEAAWLEGARINGIKNGEREREDALQILRRTFASKDGTDFGTVWRALESVQCDLREGVQDNVEDGERVLKSLAGAGNILASALRLWLACLPPLDKGASLSTPPFALPLSELSTLSATLVKHPIWSLPSRLGAIHLQIYLRPLSRLVSYFHRVSRHIPGTTPQLWFAQALVFLPCLRRGDEPYAFAMLDAFSFVMPQSVGGGPAMLQDIHVDILRPFYDYAVRPEGEVYVAPLRPNTESISRSLTLRLPSPLTQSLESGDGGSANENVSHIFAAGLPLTRDFLFTPLTHLLRSGNSPIFRALPSSWSPSEVDVVRATLFLVHVARKGLVAHGLEKFVPSAAEIVFGCMRVCMLEHGVGAGVETEVFRDEGVEQLMEWLLEPFTVRRLTNGSTQQATNQHACSLEDASTSYLGPTPFYQFYTDLVALYGAVSFGHRIFAALLVTPTAMHYAADYRRVLWCGEDGAGSGSCPGSAVGGRGAGLGDVVRNVRISVEDVICTISEGDPREYLYPVERDMGVLGAYVAALTAQDGGGVQGFLRLVAVHHVACTVWRDLDPGTDKDRDWERSEEIRVKLLGAVLARGETGVVRDVVLYRQHAQGIFVPPPTCFNGGEGEGGDATGWRAERLAFVRRVLRDGVFGNGEMERAEALLLSTK